MNYEKKMSSADPGLIIILLDQSGSMSAEYVASQSKAEFASMAVNRVINDIVIANRSGESIKPRCFIAVIGYGNGVNGVVVLIADFLDVIANNFIRMGKLSKTEPDGAGGIIQVPYDMPIWVEPIADNGTPMGKAFKEATKIVTEWVKKYPNNAAPTIINITDGMPDNKAEVNTEVNTLMQLATSDGNTLIYNAHINKEGAGEVIFPNSKSNLVDPNAQFLFEISSVIPPEKIVDAQKAGFTVSSGALGCVFNAKAETLVRLLNFGSTGAGGKEQMN